MPDSELFQDEARRACAEVNRVFMQAAADGDYAAMSALYTDDAVLMPDGQEMIHGRELIGEYWKGAGERGMRDVVLTTMEFSGEGDFRYEIGRVDITIEPAGRDSVILFGKYILVWKRTPGGSWKLRADIWNLNQAP